MARKLGKPKTRERTISVEEAEPNKPAQRAKGVMPWWTDYLSKVERPRHATGTDLVESVVGPLERAIRDGLVSEGDRLPPERMLSAQLGVSRATVREALHELELKGLVERRQGRGTVVLETGRGELTQLLIRRLDSGERALAEIMDFREAIEVPITARAAKYATRADVVRLEGLADRMESEVSGKRHSELDAQFHESIARATHNPLLVKLVRLSADWTTTTRNRRLEGVARRRGSLEGHREILNRIRDRDPEGAAQAMQDHLRRIYALLAGEIGSGRRG